MGGTDDSSNLIELTIEEHAEAHRKLWEEHGKWQDYIAWQGLSGYIASKEVHSEATKAGMRNWWNNLSLEEKEDYKKRCSKRPEDYVPHKGHTYKHSDEAKIKISSYHKSKEKSQEHKLKISENRKGKGLGEKNSMSSAENRAKVSQSKLGRKRVYMPDGSFRYVLPEKVV